MMTTAKPKRELRINRPVLAPSDWRWDRLRELSEPGRRRSRDEDRIVVEALPAARTYFKEYDERFKRFMAMRPFIEFLYACNLRQMPDHKLRMEVEGRILARQSDEEIAELCGLMPQTVRWYHDIFFDVRDRLSAGTWVTLEVIRYVGGQPLNYHYEPTILKLFAYEFGPKYVDRLLQYFERRARAEEIITGRDGSSLMERLDFLRIHSIIVVMSLPMDENTSRQHLRAVPYLQVCEDDGLMRGETPGLGMIVPPVEKLLDEIEIQPPLPSVSEAVVHTA